MDISTGLLVRLSDVLETITASIPYRQGLPETVAREIARSLQNALVQYWISDCHVRRPGIHPRYSTAHHTNEHIRLQVDFDNLIKGHRPQQYSRRHIATHHANQQVFPDPATLILQFSAYHGMLLTSATTRHAGQATTGPIQGGIASTTTAGLHLLGNSLWGGRLDPGAAASTSSFCSASGRKRQSAETASSPYT